MPPCLAKNRYVYFDWNVFAAFRDTRHHANIHLKKAVQKGKLKGYSFPFSHAHLRDLFNKSNFIKDAYTENDFNAIRQLSNNTCIGFDEESGITLLDKVDIEEAFKNLQAEHSEQSYLPDMLFGKDFYDTLRHKYLHEPDKFIRELAEKACFHEANIVRYLSTDDEKFLSDNFITAITDLHNLTHNGTPSSEYIIANGFRFLDFTKLFAEKITEKNAPLNVMNDSNHLLAARDSKYFVTEDAKLRKKIVFLKKCYEYQAEPISIAEFCQLFCNNPPEISST